MFKVKNTRPYPKSLNLTYLSNQVQKQKMGFFDDIVDRGQEAVDDAVDTVTGGDDDEDEPSQESDTGSEPNQATEDFVDEYGPGDDSGGSDSSNDSVSDVVNDAPSDTGSDSSPEQDFVDRYGGGSDDSDDDTGGGGGSYYEDDDDDGRDPDPPDNTADNDPDTVDTAETSTGTDTQTDDRPEQRFVDRYGPGSSVEDRQPETNQELPTEEEVQDFNELRERSAENALGIDNEPEEEPLLPGQTEFESKDRARRALAGAVAEEPQIADRARGLRNDRNPEFERELIEDTSGLQVEDVQQFNRIIERNQIQNDNLNTVVGPAQAAATTEYFNQRLEGNPVSSAIGTFGAGLQLGAGETGDIVTGDSRFEVTEEESEEFQETQEDISGFVTSSVSEAAALPDLAQGGFGVAGRAATGDTTGKEVGSQFFGSIGEAGQQAVQSAQEDPFEAGFKGALTLGAGAAGYYGGRFARTGKTPDLDLDPSTLAKKGRSKARDVEQRLRVTGEPVKSSDRFRLNPASIEDGKPVTPTGKASGSSNVQGTSSNAFPLSMNQQTTFGQLLRGQGPRKTEKTRDLFFVDEDKVRPGQTVKEGKQVRTLEKTRPDQDTLEMQVDDVRETGRQSGFEALIDQDTDVNMRNRDVSELVDIADDSGNNRRGRKGQLELVTRDKTRTESTDSTGRNIDAQDRRQDVADERQQFFDSTDDFDMQRNREFNRPTTGFDVGIGSFFAAAQSEDLGLGLNQNQDQTPGIGQRQEQSPFIEEDVGPFQDGETTGQGETGFFPGDSFAREEEPVRPPRREMGTDRPRRGASFASFGEDKQFDALGDFDQDVAFEKEEGRFAESLTASLFNIQAEEGFEEEKFVGTGFGIRPLLPEDEEI